MIESSLPPSAELQSEPLPLPGRSFGRAARSVIGYGLLLALMFLTPLLVFVPAALIHCAIRNGRRAAWASLVVAVAITAPLYLGSIPAAQPDAVKMAWAFLAAVVMAIALPAMTAVPMVERGETFGRVLLFSLSVAAIGLALTEIGSQLLASYSAYAGHVAHLRQVAGEALELYRKNGVPPNAMRLLERWSGYYTNLLQPGFLLVNVAFSFVLSLLMIGRLKAWREHVSRRSESEAPGVYLFRNLSLPDWVLFAFILGGLTPIATGLLHKVAANVLTLVVFLYVLQGLAIFRFMLVAVGAGVVGTVVGWTLLALLTVTGPGPLLLGLAGLFDPFFDFRHFKKRKDDSHESHSD